MTKKASCWSTWMQSMKKSIWTTFDIGNIATKEPYSRLLQWFYCVLCFSSSQAVFVHSMFILWLKSAEFYKLHFWPWFTNNCQFMLISLIFKPVYRVVCRVRFQLQQVHPHYTARTEPKSQYCNQLWNTASLCTHTLLGGVPSTASRLVTDPFLTSNM